jgi:hypothetical protein
MCDILARVSVGQYPLDMGVRVASIGGLKREFAMKPHRIIWSSKPTGSEETAFIGSLRDAHKSACKMVGEPVSVDGVDTGCVVESAYVADENGNPLSADADEASYDHFNRYIAGDR